MSINNVSQSYPGPDDGDPPFRDVVRPEPKARSFASEADIARLINAGLWGPAEVAESERRRQAGTWPLPVSQ
jgi:hypothetical protein